MTFNPNIIGYRESIYKSFFSFIVDGSPAENAKENFVELLKNEFKYRNIDCDDYSFPPQEFVESINKKYEEEKASILELFANGSCLTFKSWEFLDKASLYIESQKEEAISKGRYLFFKNVEFPLFDNELLAFFSDGTFLISKSPDDKRYKQFVNIVQSRGYTPKEPLQVSSLYIDKINAYARKVYADKIVETDLEEEKKFIEHLFANNTVCYTASKEAPSYKTRNFLALFSNGRFIVSEKYKNNKYNRDLANKVTDFRRSISKFKIMLEMEYVPHHYIESIYKKAEEFECFLSVENAKEIIDERQKKLEEKYPERSKERKDAFIEDLFKNNNACLTITNLDDFYTSERDEYALFENDRFIVNKERDWSPAHRELAYSLLKKSGKILIPEYVPANYLPAIYERALKTQKSAKDIYIEMLKKKAKKLTHSLNISHTQALEEIARSNAFPNWKKVCDIDEDTARINLGKDKEKDIYIGMIENQANVLSEKENISLDKAKDKCSLSYGFNNWEHLTNVSIETLLSKIIK